MAESSTGSSTGNGGIGFTGMLTILFIGLKLAGVIDWSWWWVLSPLWIGFVIGVTIILIGLCIVWIARRAGR